MHDGTECCMKDVSSLKYLFERSILFIIRHLPHTEVTENYFLRWNRKINQPVNIFFIATYQVKYTCT